MFYQIWVTFVHYFFKYFSPLSFFFSGTLMMLVHLIVSHRSLRFCSFKKNFFWSRRQRPRDANDGSWPLAPVAVAPGAVAQAGAAVRCGGGAGARRCGPSSHLPAVVAHLGGSPEPGPCAGAPFRLPGLETVPQEREVYHPHRGDRRGGLFRCGSDPVTMSIPCQQEATPTHHSFIHSGARPCLPDTALSQAAPTTGVGRDEGRVNHF